MTLMALDREKEPSATAKIDSPLTSVRKPLFLARTCLAATNDGSAPASRRSSTIGIAMTTTLRTNTTPAATAPARTLRSLTV